MITPRHYEELREVIDNGHESMTHEDAVELVRYLHKATDIVRGRYTVLLLRPDYVANNFGQDTYLSFVSASSPAEAQVAAQQEAAEADRVETFDDYFVLAVFEGQHSDVKEGP